MLFCVAMLEYYHYIGYPAQPIFGFVTFGLFGIFTVYKDWKLQGKAKRVRLGSEGEKIVAQELDGLKQKGYSVFHDIVVTGNGSFNIDHVVISTKGIFAIETKTVSKPVKESPKVRYDGEKVVFSGGKFDFDSTKQVKAIAKWLSAELEKSTGKAFQIKPVLVFPEWLVDEYTGKDLWILNPKRLALYIDKQPELISESDAHMVAYHLSTINISQ